MAPFNEEPWQMRFSKIHNRASYVLDGRRWTDCTFHFGTGGAGVTEEGSQQSLHAHKLILAMASPVFEAMFYGNVGDQENSVNISDIDRPTFAALLKYTYTDETFIMDTEAAMSLFKAANKYMVVHLEKMCLDYLSENLSPDNVCQIYEFSCFFNEKSLEEKCLEIIGTKTQFVLKSTGFRNANPDTLKKIVSMDELDINNEMDLLNALLDYTENVKTPDNTQTIAIELEADVVNQGQGDMKRSNKSAEDNGEKLENDSLDSSKQKLIETRLILKGVIEDIRFLSMTPNDLAKIYENTTLLFKDEICALLSNMCSPNSRVPMPDGFSNIRKPRTRRSRCEVTFRHTVNDIKNLNYYKRSHSSPCYVRDLPWRITAVRYLKNESSPNIDYLGLFLDCMALSLPAVSEDWSCNAKFELRLLSNDPNVEPRTKYQEHIFCNKQNAKGLLLVAWNELIDPKNNFIKNDSITVEVHITTEPVQGANILPLVKRIWMFKF